MGLTVIDIIRVIAPEFADLSDATLESWIEILAPMVSKKQFGKLYKQALAFMVCHKLKLAGYGEDASADATGSSVSASSTSNSIASISAGAYSISYNASSGADATVSDAEFGRTTYGMQFIQIRRSVIVPIHISGQSY